MVESESPTSKADYPRDEDDEGQSFGDQEKDSLLSFLIKSSSDTPVLDNFGIDLTKAAEEGRLDPVVAGERDRETCADIVEKEKKTIRY